MMIDFNNRESWWDITPVLAFIPALDLTDGNDWAITMWVWTDLVDDAYLHEIILHDVAQNQGRYRVPRSTNYGWNKVTAEIDSLLWENSQNIGISPAQACLDTILFIELWTSCWEEPGNNIYLDDLRFEIAPVPLVPPFQIASFDDIADEGWYDDRHTDYMEQNDVNVEGTGSMRIAFSNYPGSNPDDKENISVSMAQVPAFDFNDIYKNWAITVWVWSDPAADSRVEQIILFDLIGNAGRHSVPPPATAGWHKVSALNRYVAIFIDSIILTLSPAQAAYT